MELQSGDEADDAFGHKGGGLGEDMGCVHCCRHSVELGFSIVLRKTPFRFKESFALQAPECRIESALLNDQRIITLAPDQVCDGIAVKRPPHQRLQDQDIQCAAHKLEL